jgi:N-acetylglucosaminyldiphosphoundecaprenol N-acetyl-beta-D-mannosaminyltransferase
MLSHSRRQDGYTSPSNSAADSGGVVSVLGVPVRPLNCDSAVAQIGSWAGEIASRYVCASNVHMLMEAHDDPAFHAVLTSADLITADGMPVVWVQRGCGHPSAQRVHGTELMLRLCEYCAQARIPIGLYGGSTETLARLTTRLLRRWPDLEIAVRVSPPFRPLTEAEDQHVVRDLNASGARILFVSLGCPKQEVWMARHKPDVSAVMVGVGAAFDFIAGTKPRAPRWMRDSGLEWMFRFATEPRRLFWRYCYHNPRFVLLMLGALRRWRATQSVGRAAG